MRVEMLRHTPPKERYCSNVLPIPCHSPVLSASSHPKYLNNDTSRRFSDCLVRTSSRTLSCLACTDRDNEWANFPLRRAVSFAYLSRRVSSSPKKARFSSQSCANRVIKFGSLWLFSSCLLYTSDAADDLLCVDLGGRRII